MKCAGCDRELEIGDTYIIDTPSAFMGKESEHDALIAYLLGGADGQIIYCDDCTVSGGEHLVQTYWGDDDAA